MEQRFPLLLLPVLFQLRAGGAEAGGREVFGVRGSSVLLDPEHEANLSESEVMWTFIGSNGKLVTILDYVPSLPIAEPNKHFTSRLQFNSSNGSLTLNDLNPGDQGVYHMTVDDELKWSASLKLIEALPEPSIVGNSTCMDTTIELTCRVSAGTASSTLWWKDDEVITNGQQYQLVQNNSTLIISRAIKSNCGNYTCIMENPVSKRTKSYALIIHGLAYIHYSTVAFSIAAFVTAVATLLTAVITFLSKAQCWSKYCKERFQFVREKMQHFLEFAPVLSFLFLFIACVCWMQTEVCREIFNIVSSVADIIATPFLFAEVLGQTGPSGSAMILLVLLFVHLIITIYFAFNMVTCETLHKILSTKRCRVIFGLAAPVGGIIGICVSSILIGEVMKQAGEECEPAAYLWPTIIPAVVLTLVILGATFQLYKIHIDWKRRTSGTPSANTYTSVKSSDECQHSGAEGNIIKSSITTIAKLIPSESTAAK
ncbi:uncharacterized protein LOC144496861 isoform X2 [Mustelus asterias]